VLRVGVGVFVFGIELEENPNLKETNQKNNCVNFTK